MTKGTTTRDSGLQASGRGGALALGRSRRASGQAAGLWLVLAALGVTAAARAQDLAGAARWADSARTAIEAARIRSDTTGLAEALALVERALTAFPGDALLLHYRGYALYRLATTRSARNDAAEVGQMLEDAQTALEESSRRLQLPETYALLSGVMGQRIGRNPLRAITLGRQAGQAMDRAIELGPNDPRVWLLRGIGAIFSPAMFGGGLERAEEYLRRAIDLYPADRPARPNPAWGHDEAYTWMGIVHQRRKRPEEARAAFERALAIEPENGWVRYNLLPSVSREPR